MNTVRINLLPHRQIKRAERQRQFGLMGVAVVVLGLAIIFSGYTYISAEVSAQNSRNQRLKEAIAKLDSEIKEIAGLKEKIGELRERIQAVESLQSNRSLAVTMLDEIARQIPEAIILKSLKQKGELITLEGIADTNARVAILVGNLSHSTVLNSPQLVEVKSVTQNNQKMSAFIVTVKLKVAAPAADAKGQAKPKGGKA
jgi:type IV pilus assembly protein PilN